MRRLLALILPCLVYFSLVINANAQQQLGTAPIERTLGPGQVHEFTVKVEENNFVQLVVDQRGIDVIVKVFSPEGKSVGEFDSPTGADGSEDVSFVAVAAGSYRVSVGPLDPAGATEGHYQIKLLELRQATDQELKSTKNQVVAKAKGLALLTDIEGLIPQIKSAQTRITTEVQVAQLLWESNEKRASKYLADAITGFKEYLATLDTGNEEYFQQYQMCSQLRQEMIEIIARRDPEAALNFLYSTVLPPNPNGNEVTQSAQDNALELMIANQVMEKDPNRALQIARQNLKKGFPLNLETIVSQLQIKKPELAAELANEIATKLLNEKLLKNHEASMLAVNLIRLYQVSQKNLRPVSQNSKDSRPPLLPEDKYRELFEKIVKEAFAYSRPATQSNGMERESAWVLLSGLQTFVGDLDTFVPGGAAAVEKKLAGLNVQGIQPVALKEAQAAIGNSPADAALDAIEKAPPELQEQLYMQLAVREAMNGEGARARQIVNEHVTNILRQQALATIQQQELDYTINSGKVEDALRTVAAYRNPRDRARHLVQIANLIGSGQKRANAINLLEQARSLLGPSLQAQDEDQMQALFEIARVYSRFDSKRAFEIIEPLIDQVNDLCAAMRTLDGFGAESFEEDELNLRSGQPVANVAAQMAAVLGSIALVNFEGAKTEAERIRFPEVRLRTYIEIAQQTIQGAK